jgi:uncharacterized protein
MSKVKPRPEKYRVAVKRGLAGLGLFAQEDIPKDKFIIEYFGPILDAEATDKKGGKYLFGIDDEYAIDGTSRHNKARYINHSCDPNCEPEIDGQRVLIYSIKAIKIGEELTYDYGKEYFNDYIKPHGCRCGAC